VRGESASERADKNRSRGIRVYNAAEIEGIRKACLIGREVLDLAGRAVKAGVTTDFLDSIVHEETIKRNAYPSPLNYYEFPKSVCTSVVRNSNSLLAKFERLLIFAPYA